jgi:hypothetical protein
MLPVAKVQKLMADLSAKFEAQIGKLGNQVLSKAAAATQPKEAGTNQEAPKCNNFKRTARVSEKNKRA